MANVYIPVRFQQEIKYALDVLLKYILRIEFMFIPSVYQDCILELPNGSKLILKDSFWKNIQSNEYIKSSNLPGNIKFASNKFIVENEMPVIYGNDNIEVKENKITCGIDVVASTFFMLSRWEETVNTISDEHGRSMGRHSTAYKNNFLHRPVINEYAEMIWNMLVALGYDEKLRKPVGYKIIPTHDVDKIYYEFKWVNFIADIFLDRNQKRAIKRLTLPRKNYWDTFSWLMDQSEKNNLTSIFYFMADSKHKLDDRYSMKDDFIKEKIELIKKRGHKIGIHPGYDTMLNKDEWLRQKVSLEEEFDLKIEESRQHYLRFKIPDTLSFIESTGIKVDSSLGYSDVVGFRCGTSCEFPLFDITNRKMLNVLERPLIIMETVLRDRRNPEVSALKAIELIESYKDTCRKYKIPLTILFHTNSFDPIRWHGWKDAYANHFLV